MKDLRQRMPPGHQSNVRTWKEMGGEWSQFIQSI